MNAWRLVFLAGSGIVAVVAANEWAMPASSGDDVVAATGPSERPRPGIAPSAPPSPAGPAEPAPRSRGIAHADHASAFEPLNWQPPPQPPAPPAPVPPPPPPPPPPAPTAPKLPFTFMGIFDRGALPPQAAVAKGDALLLVTAGEVIDNGAYRVDSVEPTAVVFTYLPLGTRQTLAAPGVTP